MALSSLKVPFLCHFAFSLRYPKTIPDICCLLVRKVKSKHVVTDSPEGVFAFSRVLFAAQVAAKAAGAWVRVQCRQRHFSHFRQVSNILLQSFMGIAPPLALSHSPGRRILIMGLSSQVNEHSQWKPCSHTSASNVY